MRLYAVRVFVRRWEEACSFYGTVLGLEERYRNDGIGWAEYDVGGPSIGVERVAEGDGEGAALVGRFVGISLRVDDIDAAHRELVQRGVAFTAPPEKQPWGGSLAHFRDPDGNVLTLLG